MKNYLKLKLEGEEYRVEIPDEFSSFSHLLEDFIKVEIDFLKSKRKYSSKEELFLSLAVNMALFILKMREEINKILEDG